MVFRCQTYTGLDLARLYEDEYEGIRLQIHQSFDISEYVLAVPETSIEAFCGEAIHIADATFQVDSNRERKFLKVLEKYGITEKPSWYLVCLEDW